MKSDRFEQAFGDYIDCSKYDEAESALFTIVRKAFSAGWDSAMRTSSGQSETCLPIDD